MDNKIAEKKIDTGTINDKIKAMVLPSIILLIVVMISKGNSVINCNPTNNPMIPDIADKNPDREITPNFPSNISILPAGDVSRVSIVPLSFSPAPNPVQDTWLP